MAEELPGREIVINWLNDTKGLPEARRMTLLITRLDEAIETAREEGYGRGFSDGRRLPRPPEE